MYKYIRVSCTLKKEKQNKTKAWVQEGLYKKIIGMVKIYKFENFL